MILEYVSASQVQRFEECPRKWYESYVLGNRQPETDAMRLGTLIHKEVEHYLLTGEVRDSDWADLVREGASLTPRPSKDMLVEHKLVIPTWEGGPEWVGYLDLGYLHEGVLCVDDWKTKSSFNYCKSPEELANDIQMGSYGLWLLAMAPKLFGAAINVVKLSHINLKTKGKKEARRVEVVVNKEQIVKRWEKSLELVREMVSWAEKQPEKSETLPPNPKMCGAYGGCFYRPICGFDVAMDSFLVRATQKGAESVEKRLSWQERLKLNQTPRVGAALAVELLDAPGGLLPPDAPRRNPLPIDWREQLTEILRSDATDDVVLGEVAAMLEDR